jgi:ClpP class serine protease
VRVGLCARHCGHVPHPPGGRAAHPRAAAFGQILKAHEALQLGLVTQIVEQSDLLASARALAQTLLLNSPQAMQAIKCLLSKHAKRRLDEEIEDAIKPTPRSAPPKISRKACWPSSSAAARSGPVCTPRCNGNRRNNSVRNSNFAIL